jgi:hypothetical protein
VVAPYPSAPNRYTIRFIRNRTDSARGQEAAVRIALLVTDPHLTEAIAAALAAMGSVHVPADAPALEANDWDVCVTEAGFVGMALEARENRGLVVLTGTSTPRGMAPPGRGVVVLLRVPFALADLRQAVRTAAAAAWAGEGPAAAP